MTSSGLRQLLAVLDASRGSGFLGPGPLETHVEHASGFAHGRPPGDGDPARALDLGSGGGVPGLVLAAVRWPTAQWVLVEASARRCDFLVDAVARLGLGDRVEVRQGRAEELGRDAGLRATCDLVVARSFGPPAVVAECGAPFLAPDGRLVVSEPPGGRPDAWDRAGLALLGLAYEPLVADHAFAVLRAVSACPDRYPRGVGVPAKRPLFGRST